MEATTSPFEILIEYLAQRAAPKEIVDFTLPEHTQERIRELLDANNAGKLTREEQAELDQVIQFNRFMMRLKTRALRELYGK